MSIITIGRQFGSGGREIGKKLAEKLEIPFYDKELITLAAKESGMSKELFEDMDEKPTNSLLYSLATGMYLYGARYSPYTEMPLSDKLFLISSDTIRQLADQGPCVLVGRCADYVLREREDLASIFIYADLPYRIQRITRLYGVPVENVENTLAKADKQRSNYYNYFTGKNWGAAQSYHLCLNSGMLEVDGTVEMIRRYLTLRQRK